MYVGMPYVTCGQVAFPQIQSHPAHPALHHAPHAPPPIPGLLAAWCAERFLSWIEVSVFSMEHIRLWREAMKPFKGADNDNGGFTTSAIPGWSIQLEARRSNSILL